MSTEPRTIDVSMLRKKTRVQAEAQAADEDRSVTLPPRRQREPQVIVTDNPEPAAPVVATEPTSTPAAPPAPPAPVARKQVTVLMSHDLKARANQAFRMTSSQEGNRSFADFVARALEAEISRLEALYNGGARYEGDAGTLPLGRPLS